jgi:hypothetical protein
MVKIRTENMKNIIRTSIGYPYDFTERVLKNKKTYSYEELLNDGFMVIYDIIGGEGFHNQILDIIGKTMKMDGVVIVDEMPHDILNKYYEKIRKSGGLGDFPTRILQLLSWSHELFSKNGSLGCITLRNYDVENENLPEGWFHKQYILTNNEQLFVNDILCNIMKKHAEKLSLQLASTPKEEIKKRQIQKIEKIETVLDRVDKTTQEININTKAILEIVKNNPQKITDAIDKLLNNRDIETKDKEILDELKDIEEISDWAERLEFWYNKVTLLSPIISALLINYLK